MILIVTADFIEYLIEYIANGTTYASKTIEYTNWDDLSTQDKKCI
jgi:hypothetical protein